MSNSGGGNAFLDPNYSTRATPGMAPYMSTSIPILLRNLKQSFQRRDIKTCSNPISLEIYSWAFVETTFPNLDGGLRFIQLVQHRSSCVLHRPSLSTKLSKNLRHRRGLSS